MFRLSLVLLSSILVAGQSTPRAGQVPTRQRDLVLEKPAEPKSRAPISVPRGYALIIGVAQYENLDASKQLQFPESDADAIYRILISQEGGAFPSENVHLLKGREATLARIRHELEEWLPSIAQPADRVVVFFAGHGFVKAGRGYLAAWDVNPVRLETTAYPMTRLGDVLANRVKARSKVLLTDACHSGKINAETTNEALDSQFNSLPTNFLNLTATDEHGRSYEDRNLSTGFGFFTYFLVQAWKGYADTDPCDGVITAEELVEYVRFNVQHYAKEHQVSQTPSNRGDYEPTMLLGVSKGCLALGSATASMLGTATIETNMDDVDVYIDGALEGKLSKAKPLVVPGLPSGSHEIKGVKQGYEPDLKEILIAPGQEVTVKLRIRYVRQIKKAAVDLNEDGEKLLFTRRSTVNPLNVVPVPRSQGKADLQEARALFTEALNLDSNYSKAAFNLGQVNQLLSDEDGSVTAYRRAIQIDASYLDARIQYAAVLIERGDADEAIRQLTEVLRLEGSNDLAYSFLARAYWDKGVWERCVESADKAILLAPSNDQAHLWRADALRQLAVTENDHARQTELYVAAREDYRVFLSLTNFSTPIIERLAFHFIGFRVGSRRHPDRQEAFNSQRSSGYLGLCLAENKIGNRLRAREYCERALGYEPDNAIAYFILGNVNRDLYNQTYTCKEALAAGASYRKMLDLNPDLDESRHARDYLEQIKAIVRDKGC